jgi:uncharacterized protein (TIGR02118 family)
MPNRTSSERNKAVRGELTLFDVIFLVKRNPLMTQAEFADYWVNTHTPLTSGVPGVVSYVCYTTTGAPEGHPAYDGVAVLTFENEDAYQKGMASEEFKTAIADAPNFQNTDLTTALLADRHVIV